MQTNLDSGVIFLSNANGPAIKRMADFLRQGAKMLNINCPECNNPLFKLKNSEIFCPSCQKKVVTEKQEKVDNVPETLSTKDSPKAQTLAGILKWQLQELGNKLNNETDIHAIKHILKAIWLIVQILKDLEGIQGS